MSVPKCLPQQFFIGIVAFISLSAGPGIAQEAVPMLINFEGELRSPATGEPVPDGAYTMLFRIHDVEFGGTPLWEEVYSTVYDNAIEVREGIVSVLLGSGEGDPLDPSLFNGADRWLEIRVEAETLEPRQRITSVAYSMVSENSRLLDGREASEFADAAHMHVGQYISATGPQSMSGSSDGAMLSVSNDGSGSGLYGWHAAISGTAPGIQGVSASTSGSAAGVVGEISSTSPGGFSAGVRGINNGTGPLGIGVWGSQEGSGWGVHGTSVNGTGVYGRADGGLGTGVLGSHAATTGTAPGIHGVSASTSSDAAGVVGEITSAYSGSAGVRGINNETGQWGKGSGVYGSHFGSGNGVYGTSVDGTGVVGVHTATTGIAPGVHGTSASTSDRANGVFGEITSTSPGAYSAGVRGINRGTGGLGIGVYGSHSGSGWGVYGYSEDGRSVYGESGGAYAGYFWGRVHVRGDLTASSKSFIQPHPTDPGKQIVYVCLEGGENGVYVRGSGQLENGRAEIELPEHFALVAAEEGLTAQITPRDGNALGYLYVEEVLPDHVVVAESQGGTSDARFDYVVMGVRRGFEEHQVIRENDLMKPDEHMSQEEYEEWMALKKNRGMQKLLIENGTLTPEGKINQETAAKLDWKLGPKTREERFERMSPRVPKGAREGEQPAGDLS
jgi:hypothetical protein